jgi:hypothetical protein
MKRLPGKIPLLITLLLAAMACNLPTYQATVTETPTATIEATTLVTATSQPVDDNATATVEPEETGAPTPTVTPEPSSAPEDDEEATPVAVTDEPTNDETPEHGDPLYETDFSSAWPEITTEREGVVRGSAIPSPEGYVFDVVPNWGHWVYTGRYEATDFYAEIDAEPQSCPAGDGAYGLLFHFVDTQTFRAVAITCSGEYIVYNRTATETDPMIRGELPTSIDPTSGEHTIAVMVLDNSLTLYVDGQQIDTLELPDSPSGGFGPYTETGDEAITITFTGLRVYAAEP